MPLLKARGETGWTTMTKGTTRLLLAIAGTLLLLVPLLWRRRCGDVPMLLAAAFLATSPLLVYYSRMFIHEMLLALFGMLALTAITRKPRYGIAGLWIGLMFATKETFAISMIAWTGAGALVAMENRENRHVKIWFDRIKAFRWQIFSSIAVAALVSVYFYTDSFRQMSGAIDAVRTYFVYKTVGGHDKAFGYYFSLLCVPFKGGGVWWFGTPVAFLAALAFFNSWRRESAHVALIRFLGYATLGHFLIYSLIVYKTPWLACLPWAHVCLLAGFCLTNLPPRPQWLRPAICLFAGASIVTQYNQARNATGRLGSDERNPFAYVPTRRDVETIEPWLLNLEKLAPLEPIAVVGTDYWPLPWYLRHFEEIGYWPEVPDDLAKMPVVFAMPDTEDAVAVKLESTHMFLPRGLRADVPVGLFIRNDIWKMWMK